jgi:hypothetical protein
VSLDTKPFPIMGNVELTSVPWWLAETARGQLRRNHSQTVERLAERGGLGVVELAGALTGRSWSQLRDLTETQALAVIRRRLEVEA